MRHPAPVRLLTARLLAVVFAATWLLLPGFGLVDLSVSWDPDWPVVLEASWGLVMTVLVGGSLLAVAVRLRTTAAAELTLLVTLTTWLLAAVAGLEEELLGFAGLLAVQLVLLSLLLPGRERVRPVRWSPQRPLLALGAVATVPWVLHAGAMFARNRANVHEWHGDITMGTDHYAVQGGLAVSLVVLCVLAALWPRGRRHLGVSTALAATYLGLVSLAHPATDAALGTAWSALAIGWGLAVGMLSLRPRSEVGELGGEVVEAERAL